MDTPPNVLFLMDDEHRPDVLGYMGNDVVRTPTLDRLAEDACVFENAFTPSPRCVPARQCLIAGELPRTCNCLKYGEGLPEDKITFPRKFAEYGYQTTLAGNGHFVGESSFHGYQKRIGVVNSFETIERAVDYDRPNNKWSDAKEIRRAGVGSARNVINDMYTTKGVENFIETKFVDPYYDRVNPDQPTFLSVSMLQPHYPYYTVDEDRFQYYLNRVDPYIETSTDHPMLSQREVVVGEAVTKREVRRATAAYYAMIETVDEMYGRILDSLEHAGEDIDEWVIVFCSDHGEMLGEHGVWEKGSFYESSARVPLLIRWPEQFDGHRIRENVNLCDVFSTLCELAEIPLLETTASDSRSLVPLLVEDYDAWYDRHSHDETVSAEGDKIMIKRGNVKYMWFGDGALSESAPEVIFDLAQDPNETENLADDPDYADILATFRNRRRKLGYGPNADSEYDNAGYSR